MISICHYARQGRARRASVTCWRFVPRNRNLHSTAVTSLKLKLDSGCSLSTNTCKYSFRFEMVIDWIILFSMRTLMDRNSVQWLSAKWVAAGRPVIPRPEWDLLMKKVGDVTEREAIR